MKRIFFTSILILGLVAINSYQTFPQTHESVYDRINSTAAKLKRYKNYDWKTASWTEDNTPYRRTRIYIDKFIVQGQSLVTLEKKYRALAEKDLYDPQKQFRWAYVAYKLGMSRRPKDANPMYPAIKAMDRTLRPFVYDWTRLRFLMERAAQLGEPYKEVAAVGKRLLKHDPNDREVMYQVASLLSESTLLSEIQLGLQYALRLRKLEPKNYAYMTVEGATSKRLWEITGKPEYGKRATAAYKLFLKTAPNNDYFRRWAQHWIDYIRKNSDKQGNYTRR